MKNHPHGSLFLRVPLLVLLVSVISLVGLAFTFAPSDTGKIVGEGRQSLWTSEHALTLLYNGAVPENIYYHANSGPDTSQENWQKVDSLPGPATDGSNLLRLYDANSPEKPVELTVRNVTNSTAVASHGAWRAELDDMGVVWLEKIAGGSEEDDEHAQGPAPVPGLPPASSVALGDGHAVALSDAGEVFIWKLDAPEFPVGLSPPVRLSGLSGAVAIGAWREYGVASTGGDLWIWRGNPSQGFDMTDDEILEAFGFLAGRSTVQATGAPAATPVPQPESAPVATPAAAPAPVATTTETGHPVYVDEPDGVGMTLWLRADKGVVVGSTGVVSRWEDQSGRGNHGIKSGTGSYGATVDNDALGSLPAVHFTETGTGLEVPSLWANAQGGTVFIIIKPEGIDLEYGRQPLNLGQPFVYGFSDYMMHYMADGLGRAGTPEPRRYEPFDGPGYLEIPWSFYNIGVNASSKQVWHNARLLGDEGPGNLQFGGAGWIGKGWPGYVAEIIVYSKKLTEFERKKVSNYLNTKYALGLKIYSRLTAELNTQHREEPSVTLTWEADSSAASYRVQARLNGHSNYTTLATLPAGTTTFEHTGLEYHSIYSYRVRINYAEGEAVYTNERTVATLTPPSADPGDALSKEGMRLWLRADKGVTLGTNGRVTRWEDLSGQGHHATAASSGVTVTSGTPGLVPVLKLNSLNGPLFLPAIWENAQGGSVFAVLKWDNPHPVYDEEPFNLGQRFRYSYDSIDCYYIEDALGRGTSPMHPIQEEALPLGQWSLFNTNVDAASKQVWHNTTLIGSEGPGVLQFGGTGSIGSSCWTAQMAEIIAYSRKLSEAERAEVTRYLNARYGLWSAAYPKLDGFRKSGTGGANAPGVALTWNSVSGAQSYEIQVRAPGENAYTTLATLPAGTTAYEHAGLMPGSTYSYQLLVRLASGEVLFSTGVAVQTPAPPPPDPADELSKEGMRLWLRADKGIVDDGNGVRRWEDQSGNGLDAVQEDMFRCPDLAEDASDSGLPAVSFDGTGTSLDLPQVIRDTAAAGEYFVVLKSRPASATRIALSVGHRTGLQYVSAQGRVQDNFGQRSLISFPEDMSAFNQWHLYSASHRGPRQDWSTWLNGRLIGGGIASESDFLWGASGRLGGSTTAVTNWDGDIAEVLVYERALSAAERAQVSRYLMEKYSLALPAAPAVPMELRTEALGASRALVRWEAPASDSVELQRRAAGAQEWTTIYDGERTTFHDTGLVAAGTYHYRVRARNASGVGDWSEPVSLTLPGANIPAPAWDGLCLWLRADRETLADQSGAVLRWRDESGTDVHAIQRDAALRPTLMENGGGNGRPALRFDGNGQYLSLSQVMPAYAASAEYFVVLKKNGAVTGRSVLGFGNPQGLQYPYSAGLIRDSFGRGSTLTDCPVPSGVSLEDWHVHGVSADGNALDWTARLDGRLTSSVRLTTSTTWTTTIGHYLGRAYSASSGTWAGDIAEVLVYKRALSAPEREEVERYLMSKYALALPPVPTPPNAPKAEATGATRILVSWGATADTVEVQRRQGTGEWVTIYLGTQSFLHDTDLLAGAGYSYRLRTRNAGGASAWSTIQTVALPASANNTLPLPGLRLWLKSDVGLDTDTSGKVSLWRDLSGNSQNATQTSAAAQPQLVAGAVVNGRPAIRFNGTGANLSLPNVVASATAAEYFVVLKAAEGGTAGRAALGIGQRYGLEYPYAAGVIRNDFGLGSGTPVSSAVPSGNSLTDWHVYSANAPGKAQNWLAKLDGLMLGGAPMSANASWYSSGTGYLGGASGTSTWAGDIAEVVAYNRTLSVEERENVERYLLGRYGLPLPVVPAAPAPPQVELLSATQTLVKWESGGHTVELQRRAGSTGEWNTVFSGTGSFLRDAELTPGASYDYRVRVRNAGGVSAWSSLATVTLPDEGTAGLALAGLRLWLRADIGVDADATGEIVRWQDISGTGLHATQTTAASRPQLVGAATGTGLPAARFNGTGASLNLPQVMPYYHPSAEYFVVLKADTAVTGRNALAFSNNGLTYPAANGKIQDDFGRWASTQIAMSPPAGVALNDWHVYQVSGGGRVQDWIARLDEQRIGYAAPDISTSWSSYCYLGRAYSASSGTWAGDIAEVLVYDHALSPEEREGTARYLARRHGFSLPATPATPPAPRVTAVSATKVALGWELGSMTDTVEVQRRGVYSDEWETVHTSTRAGWLDGTLTPGSVHGYRIRVRNAGGVSEWSPEVAVSLPGEQSRTQLPFSGLSLWLTPDGTMTDGAGIVSHWQDWSAAASRTTTISGAPRRVADTLAGNPVIRFDGTATQVSAGSFYPKEVERFVVLKARQGGATGRQLYSLGNAAGSLEYPAADGKIRDSVVGSATATFAFPAGTNAHDWHIYHTRATAESRLARVDGALAWQGAGVSSVPYSTVEIGKVGSSAAWDGDIAEVLVYSRALDTAEHAAVQSYLAAKYQIAATPPVPVNIPGQVSATLTSAGTITVSWDAVPEANATYELQVLIPGRNYLTLTLLPSGTTSYTHANLNPEVTYTYRVRARTPLGMSVYSAEASATTPALLADDTGPLPSVGMKLWLKADEGISLDANDEISQWADQSGSGNHAYNPYSDDYYGDDYGSGIFLAEDSQLASPVVRIVSDYDDYGLTLPALMTSATGGEVFVVIKVDNGIEGYPFQLDGRSFGYPSYANSSDTGSVIMDSLGRTTSVNMTVPGTLPLHEHWRLYNVSAGLESWSARLDGWQLGEFDTDALSFGNSSGVIGGSGAGYWHGDIAELIVYDRALDPWEYTLVANYLNLKYSLGIDTSRPAVAVAFGDPRDSDGDGIPDYWEKYFGSNPYRPDAHADPGSTGYNVGERYAAMQAGGQDPVSGTTLTHKDTAVGTKQDTDKDGFTDHTEAQLGYDRDDENDTPPVPRYAIIDLGPVVDKDEKPVAISEKNGWIVSNKARRWGLGKTGTTPTLLEGPLSGNVGWCNHGDYDDLFLLPISISDIGDDGAVLADGYFDLQPYIYRTHFHANPVEKHEFSGFYWNSKGEQTTLKAKSNFSFDPLTYKGQYDWQGALDDYQPDRRAQAWGVKFLEGNNTLFNVAELGHYRSAEQPERHLLVYSAGYPVKGTLGTEVQGWKQKELGGPTPYYGILGNRAIGASTWSPSRPYLQWVNRKGGLLYQFGWYNSLEETGWEWTSWHYANLGHSVVVSDITINVPSPELMENGKATEVEVYKDTALNCLNLDGVAVGARWANVEQKKYGVPVFTRPGTKTAHDLPERKNPKSTAVEDTGPALFINAPQDFKKGHYTVAAKRHLWDRKVDPVSGVPIAPLEFEEPARLSALVDFDCGWTDGWEITGMNDAGLLIGTGWKFVEDSKGKKQWELTAGGEAIISHDHYVGPSEDWKKETKFPKNSPRIEKHLFVMVPMTLLADSDRDGKIIMRDIYEETVVNRQKTQTLVTKHDAPSSKALPFRFWVNDDSDVGDLANGASDQPAYYGRTGERIQNRYDMYVNGMADLIDWFPLTIDVQELLNQFPIEAGFKLRLHVPGQSARVIPTVLPTEEASSYQTQRFDTGFGIVLSQKSDEAGSLFYDNDYIYLNQSAPVVERLKAGPTVFMVEARLETENPVDLELVKTVGGSEIVLAKRSLYVNFSSVEKMYRWVNLRRHTGDSEARPTDVSDPKNWPDALTNGKHFIMVHGYNVNEEESRGWGSESFKRMYWSGSKAMHTFVSWNGDYSQTAAIGMTPNYWMNAHHAFKASPYLAGTINTLPGTAKVVAAHSLGNMLVSAAIVDYQAPVSTYFMLDAAVPIEAYFENELNDAMVPSVWKAYDKRLWASYWWNLFPTNDGRRDLTWLRRFGDIPQAYNFYSSGEEVLNNSRGLDLIPGREYVWVYQEMHKGDFPLNLTLGYLPCQGGWGFNGIWDKRETAGTMPGDPSYYVRLSPAEAALLSDQDLRENPFFGKFTEHGLTTAQGSALASNLSVRSQTLSEAIPALSSAAGRNPISGFKLARNFDLYSTFSKGNGTGFQNEWPQERTTGKWGGRWLHGDGKDVAYYFNYPLWDKWVELGGLKQ